MKSIADLARLLTFEEQEQERARLWKVAKIMTVEELRLSVARLADFILIAETREVNQKHLALWHLRGQIATEILEAIAAGTFKLSRSKRLFAGPMFASSEEMVVQFSNLRK